MRKLLPFLFAVILFSCKKNSENHTPRDFLVNNKWSLVSILVKINGDSVSTMFPDPNTPHVLDNYYMYHADNTITVHDGPVKAPGNGGDILFSGTWSLKENNTHIRMESGESSFNWYARIIELNATTFKYEIAADESTMHVFYFKAI